jgi:glucose-6-phosphate dehydrogenase assembly protein OpcA
VLLVTLDGRAAPWDLTAEVNAVCRAEGGASICSDRIELAFGASAATRAASVVGALALSEVPVVVEAGAGAPSVLVDDLAKRCDRMIVDSALLSAARVAAIVRETEAPVADRAWVRTFTWRDLVARFFDEEPTLTSSLRRIEIARTPGGKTEPAAILIGWVASRLGWRFESHTKALNALGEGIDIALVDEARSDLGPGEITAIRFAVDAGSRHFDFAVARTEAVRTLCWSVKGAKNDQRQHPLGFRDETWVLIKTLDDRASDVVYRAAALAAAEWSAR